MNITLPPDLERLVQDSVASGRYASAEEMIQRAFELLQEKEREEWQSVENLRTLVDVGIADMEAGRHTRLTDDNTREYIEGITQRGLARLKTEKDRTA